MLTVRKTLARAMGVVLLALLGTIAVSTEASAAGEFRPIRNVGNGLCLQPQNNNVDAQVVQKVCDRTVAAQGWAALRNPNSNDYRFLNPNGWCVNALGLANGEHVRMLSCTTSGTTDNVSNAEWNASATLPATVTLRSRIHFTNNNVCLDVPGARTDVGWPMQVWVCNGSVAQRWIVGFDWP